MTTTVVYSDVADGNIESASTVYATAQSGGGTLTVDTAFNAPVGQYLTSATYRIYEAFFDFDTSVLGASDKIESVVLTVTSSGDSSATDFTIQARSDTWAAGGLTTADWVATSGLSALTPLATVATSTFPGTDVAWAFTSEAAFLTAVNKVGLTELLLCSDRVAVGTAPANNVFEFVTLYVADEAGTTKDPSLTIVSVGPTLRLVSSPMRW